MADPAPDQLLDAARAGDRVALERLLSAHRNGVYRYGLQVCRTTEDAEDAVQETLWAATRAIRKFRGTATSVVAWLFTIVRRQCYRLLDRHRRDAATLEIPPNPPSLEDEVAAQQQRELLVAALANLEPGQREVLVLRDIRGYSAPEAAGVLGISVDALKSRLHRARVILRDSLPVAGR
jgi:RNA polymerase sigma-70 factor (ECF subfamily)